MSRTVTSGEWELPGLEQVGIDLEYSWDKALIGPQLNRDKHLAGGPVTAALITCWT
jgi:hypothetical protein